MSYNKPSATQVHVSNTNALANVIRANTSVVANTVEILGYGPVIGQSGNWLGPNSGLQGAQGVQGRQGVQGLTGTQGVQGVQGRQGVQGLNGTQGTTGAGTQGATGTQGLTGTQGTTGAGTQGATGTQGTQGVQGISQAGTQGAQGVQGVQGRQGVQGLTGTQGITGTGTQGAQGVQGISQAGTQGPQGVQGVQGRQGVQGTTGGFTTSSDAQINSLGVNTAASGSAGTIRATGDITAFYSDMRLKQFIGKIEDALAKVDNLHGFYFYPNDLAQSLGYANTRQVGVSAQDVEEVLPEIIRPAPIDDQYKTLDYAKIVPLLIEAIKEMHKKIDQLEYRVRDLESR